MSTNPDVSVVLGTFQLKDKLKLVLDSFAAQTFPKDKFEVIVVDSSSTDGTSEFMKHYSASYSLRFFSIDNKGKSTARNKGVVEAKSELVIMTDADMIAAPNFIEAHVEMHRRFSHPILVQGKTWVLSEESLPVELFRRRPYITHSVVDGQKLGFYYCLTGNLSLPRQVFIDSGGLDETFTGYGWEDIDLGVRLIKGNKIPLHYAEFAVNDHFNVWSEAEEWNRRFKMGQSVSGVLAKHPSLKSFLGLNIFNRTLYRIVSMTALWKDITLLNPELKRADLSSFKKWMIRECFFQWGYQENQFISENKK